MSHQLTPPVGYSAYEAVPAKDDLSTKCSFVEGRLKACWPLEEALEGPYGRGTKLQGAKLLSFFNSESHKFSRQAVSLVSGAYKRGVQLTFCPFCAAVLHPSLAEDVTVALFEKDDA